MTRKCQMWYFGALFQIACKHYTIESYQKLILSIQKLVE